MKRSGKLLPAAALLCVALACHGGGIPAVEKILYNGVVITLDQDSTIARAVAISRGRIVAVGNDEDLLSLACPKTEKIDLAGRSVAPGLIVGCACRELTGTGAASAGIFKRYNGMGVTTWIAGDGQLADTLEFQQLKAAEQLTMRVFLDIGPDAASAASGQDDEWLRTGSGTDFGVIGGDNDSALPANPWTEIGALAASRGIGGLEALRSFTIDKAGMIGEDRLKGSIEAGKYADVVVIDVDFPNCPVERIGDIEVDMTLVGGKEVFKR